jgi:hypothetical protein
MSKPHKKPELLSDQNMYIAEKGLVESLILLSEQNIALYLVGYVPKDTYRIVGNLGCGLETLFHQIKESKRSNPRKNKSEEIRILPWLLANKNG